VYFLTFGHPLSIHAGLEDDGTATPNDPNVERLVAIVGTNPPRRRVSIRAESGPNERRTHGNGSCVVHSDSAQ
jgi:hypothetical protein